MLLCRKISLTPRRRQDLQEAKTDSSLKNGKVLLNQLEGEISPNLPRKLPFFYFVRALSFVEGYESADGPVVGFFDFWRKVTGWKFIMLPVASYTFTTSTF